MFLAFGTALFSGVANFVNKFAVSKVDSLVFTTQKNILVALFVIGIVLFLGKLPQIRRLTRYDLLLLLLIGVIGGSLPFYLFFSALKYLPAINASLIHKTLVFWVALLAFPFLRERLTRGQLGAIGLIFSANLVVGGFNGFSFNGWELMVLAATILWAVENVIAKVALRRVDPDLVVAARMGLGCGILLAATVVSGKASQLIFFASFQQFFLTVLTSVILLGYVTTWYRALQLAPATLVATVLTSATLVTNLLSAVFITHSFGLGQLAELVFVISGLWFFLTVSRRVLPLVQKRVSLSQSSLHSAN